MQPPLDAEESDSVRPFVVVVTTIHWPSTTRLCLALAEGGFCVHVVAPEDHAAHRLSGLSSSPLGRTRGEAIASIARSVVRLGPSLIIPGDELAIDLMRRLYARAMHGAGRDPHGMAELIERSLGAAWSFVFGYEKSRFVSLARSEGLTVPATSIVGSAAELRQRAAKATFPLVLKRDRSFGGQGVRIVHDVEEAVRAFAELRAAAGPLSGVKQTVKKLDLAFLDRLWRRPPAICLQQYVEGRPANRAVACWRGEVLAGLSVEVLETADATSPATVVRLIDSPGMSIATLRMVRRLGLCGLVGFDFVLEAAGGRPFLIEMNARPTQICHIAIDSRSDMIGALAEAFGDAPCRRRVLPTVGSRIVALFPQESWRDPASAWLTSAHHDVPWQSPEFVLAYRTPVAMEPPAWLDVMRRRMTEARRRLRRRPTIIPAQAIIPATPPAGVLGDAAKPMR